LRLRSSYESACSTSPTTSTGTQWGPTVLVVPGSVRLARKDPRLGCEAQWLPHLHREHAGLLRALAVRNCRGLDDSIDVRALALDGHGLVLRLYAATGHRDTRLVFRRPVTCGCEVQEAIHELVHRVPPDTRGSCC